MSLRCSATATPLAQIRWFLDDHHLEGYAPRRLSMADYVKHGGHVVSFVNITGAKVLDGGEVRGGVHSVLGKKKNRKNRKNP